MENFDLESHLQGVYSAFPEAKHRPLIGLTANYEGIDATLRERYYKQVVEAGGVPVIVPPVADTAVIINTLQQLDGLILTGGGDHNPLWMGEEPSPRLHNINRERDLAELLLVRLAFNRQIPMLGICRGIQTLAIALGGKVEQDIEQQVKHSQDADRSEPTHSVCLVKDSTLYNIYGSERIMVNSFHHQAVSQPGKRFRVIARSADNIIEAIESSEYKSIDRKGRRVLCCQAVSCPQSYSRHPLRHSDVLSSGCTVRPSRLSHPCRPSQDDRRSAGRHYDGGLSAATQAR